MVWGRLHTRLGPEGASQPCSTHPHTQVHTCFPSQVFYFFIFNKVPHSSPSCKPGYERLQAVGQEEEGQERRGVEEAYIPSRRCAGVHLDLGLRYLNVVSGSGILCWGVRSNSWGFLQEKYPPSSCPEASTDQHFSE